MMNDMTLATQLIKEVYSTTFGTETSVSNETLYTECEAFIEKKLKEFQSQGREIGPDTKGELAITYLIARIAALSEELKLYRAHFKRTEELLKSRGPKENG